MPTTILGQGCRNPQHPTGTGGYVNYGGHVAIGDGVADDTQALLDAMNLNRPVAGGGLFQQCAIYLPPGTYKCTHQLIVWQVTFFFGEPSAPPTILCPSGSITSGGYPFIYFCRNSFGSTPSTSPAPISMGSANPSTNNTFNTDMRDINVTVQSNNNGLSAAFLCNAAQQVSMRNITILQQSNGFSYQEGVSGDPSGGGGVIHVGITASGGNGIAIQSTSQTFYRNCTFNGQVTWGVGCQMVNFLNCTFNHAGTGFTVNGGAQWSMQDCTFTSGTALNLSGNYHLENINFGTTANAPAILQPSCVNGLLAQYSSGNVFYNGVNESGSSANLNSLAVVQGPGGSYSPNFPQPPSTCVQVTSAANINSALAASGSIYLSPGVYNVTGNINITSGQSIYGVGCYGPLNNQDMTTLIMQSGAFINATGNGSGSGVVLCNISVRTPGGGPVLKWNADPNGSQVLDCMFSSSGSLSTLTQWVTGGALWENCDPSLTNTVNNQVTTQALIQSQGPTYFYGLNSDHCFGPTYIINGASHLYCQGNEFEEVGGFSGGPAITIANSQNINFNLVLGGNAGAGSNNFITVDNTSSVAIWGCISTVSGGGPQAGGYQNAVLYNGTTYGPGNALLPGFIRPSSVANTVPVVGVSAATGVTLTAATLNGSVTSTGGLTVTANGFDYGAANGPPNVYGTHVATGTTVQSGSFQFPLTGLAGGAGTTYHYRSTSDNSLGRGTSGDSQFVLSAPAPHVQSNAQMSGTAGAVTTASVTFSNAQTAGNTNVIAISFNNINAAINTIGDTKGNVYQIASPLTKSATDSQVIYYSPSISGSTGANSNSITVTFTVASAFISLRAGEYNGLGSINVHNEGNSVASGVSLTASIPPTSTTDANDVIIVATNAGIIVSGPAPGFTQRLNANPYGSNFQDEKPGVIVNNITAPTPLDPTAAPSNWVENMVAFFPAGVATTIPTITTANATNVLANSATLNGTIASTGNSAITADGFDYGTTTAYGTHVAAATVQSGAFSAPISGLTSGTLYHFTATAQNAIGTSLPVDKTFQFIPPPLTVPGAFTANPTSVSSITLNWTVSTGGTGAIHYEVWHHIPGAGFTLAITTAAAAITANDTGLVSGTLYSYQIRAVDSVSATSAFSAQIDAPTYASLPGNFYASNYNVGGQNVGYFDNQGQNIGLGRVDGVDLKTTSDAPAGSGFVLGYRIVGEWTKYNVSVASTGTYAVALRYEANSTTGQFHVDLDGVTIIPSTLVALTGPWDTLASWVTLPLGNVSVNSGNHVVQILIDSAGLDFNYLSFTLAPSGWLAQVMALKSATPSSGFVIIGTPILSLESLGLIKVIQPAITILSGIQSLQAFGNPSAASGNVSIIEAPWIFDGALGTPSLAEGNAIISGSGIGSQELFGVPSFAFSTVSISLSGIVSLGSVGTPTFQEGNVFLFISSVPDSSAIGLMTLFQPGAQFISQPVILTAETFGSATIVQQLAINLQGISSIQALGTPTMNPGDFPVSLSGIGSQEAFGLGHVSAFGNVDIFLTPILSTESFGASTISGTGNVNLSLSGLSSAEVVNNLQVTQAGAPPVIVMRGIDTLESLGLIHTLLGIATINLSGMPSREQFGIPTVGFPGGPTHMGRVL